MKDRSFTEAKKSVIEQIHDGAIEVTDRMESKFEKKYVDELMNVRARASYLQSSIKKVFANDEQKHDIKVNFAKRCHKNIGLATSSVITHPESILDNKFVIN